MLSNQDKHEYVQIKTGEDDDDEFQSTESDIEDDETDQVITKQTTSTMAMKSKWDSKMWDVSRKPDQVEMSFNVNDYYPNRIFRVTKTMIIPLYIIIGLVTIAIMIIFGVTNLMTEWEAFLPILGLNIIGGFVGAALVYRFGTVEDCIDFMSLQNKFYGAEMDKLSKTKEKVKDEAKKVHFSVNKVKVHKYICFFYNM